MFRYLCLFISFILIIIDQILKAIAINSLRVVETIPFIPNLVQFTYVENYGAAFGIFKGKTIFLVGFTSIVIIGMILAIVFKKVTGNFLIFSVSLVCAGGIGNLIDRIFRGFVVDYIDISPLFNFAVFNFADCCVVIGTFLLMIDILFLQKDNKEKIKND